MVPLGEYTTIPNRIISNVKQARAAATRKRTNQNNNRAIVPASAHNWSLYSISDPFPARMNTVLQFSKVAALTVGASSAYGTEVVFRLNSPYSPLFGASPGQQPYGWDQISGLYERYFVRAVTVEVQFTDPSTDGLSVAAMVQPASGTPTLQGQSLRLVKEWPGVVSGDLNNTGSQTIAFKKRWTTAEIEGLRPRDMVPTSSIYSAETDNNPTLSPWLRVAVASYNSSDSTSTVKYSVILRYETELYSRALQVGS